MQNYYEILEISPNATSAEIKKSYIRLIKLYHPDRNPNNSNATKQTQLINEAYKVLRDPVRRIEYDNLLKLKDTGTQTRERHVHEEVPDLRCEKCNRKDSSLRVTIFIYVISLFVVTSKNGWGKILCSRCRLKYSLLWNLEVWFLGWWGIPYGPIYTIQALFNNSKGGIQPESNNVSLLSILAYDFYKRNNYKNAIECLKEKIKFQKSKEDVAFLNYLSQFKIEKSSFWEKIINFPTYIFNIPFILILTALSLYILSSNHSTVINNDSRRKVFTGFDDNKNKPIYEPPPVTKQPEHKPDEKDVYKPILKEKKLPKSGVLRYNTNKKRIAPLQIKTEKYTNYYIKLAEFYNESNTVVTIFIRAGETIYCNVPLGDYIMKYAVGDKWYGEDILFGKFSSKYKIPDKLNFEIKGNRVMGHTIELISQPYGNLEYYPIDDNDF